LKSRLQFQQEIAKENEDMVEIFEEYESEDENENRKCSVKEKDEEFAKNAENRRDSKEENEDQMRMKHLMELLDEGIRLEEQEETTEEINEDQEEDNEQEPEEEEPENSEISNEKASSTSIQSPADIYNRYLSKEPVVTTRVESISEPIKTSNDIANRSTPFIESIFERDYLQPPLMTIEQQPEQQQEKSSSSPAPRKMSIFKQRLRDKQP